MDRTRRGNGNDGLGIRIAADGGYSEKELGGDLEWTVAIGLGGAKIEAHVEEEQGAMTSTESLAFSNISHSIFDMYNVLSPKQHYAVHSKSKDSSNPVTKVSFYHGREDIFRCERGRSSDRTFQNIGVLAFPTLPPVWLVHSMDYSYPMFAHVA